MENSQNEKATPAPRVEPSRELIGFHVQLTGGLTVIYMSADHGAQGALVYARRTVAKRGGIIHEVVLGQLVPSQLVQS